MTGEKRIACVGAGYWGRNLLRNFDALHALSSICEFGHQSMPSWPRPTPTCR